MTLLSVNKNKTTYHPLAPVLRLLLLLLCSSYFGLQGGNAQAQGQQEQPLLGKKGIMVRAVVENGDTIPTSTLRPLYVFKPIHFRNAEERVAYTRLVRDVKRTLPYAKIVAATLVETYEYMETLPNDKTRLKHLKRMEKELYAQYKPELKKLTLTQGKLLIKLITRETGSSGYQLIDAFLGSFTASFWNFFAGVFGASLKVDYDPAGADAHIERVVLLVENGQI